MTAEQLAADLVDLGWRTATVEDLGGGFVGVAVVISSATAYLVTPHDDGDGYLVGLYDNDETAGQAVDEVTLPAATDAVAIGDAFNLLLTNRTN